MATVGWCRPGTAEEIVYTRQGEADHELQPPHRLLYWAKRIDAEDEFGDEADSYVPELDEERTRENGHNANLISSLTTSGMHAPVLDIDFEARLVPSRTEGHYHLYLDKEMPWWKYRFLLWALKVVGIIEPGYYGASVERRMTFCRWRIWSHFESQAQEDLARAEFMSLRERIRRL